MDTGGEGEVRVQSSPFPLLHLIPASLKMKNKLPGKDITISIQVELKESVDSMVHYFLLGSC